jgi:HPt (histidine-containing phosphotransfer) domain-containing protein
MPLRLGGIEWMPSPPLAPGDGPIDFAHLSRMTLDDTALEREVLSMFVAQSEKLMGALVALPKDARELVHTLKGSSRAIGAFAVADAAAQLEQAFAIGADPTESLAGLTAAVARARRAIEAILNKPSDPV